MHTVMPGMEDKYQFAFLHRTAGFCRKCCLYAEKAKNTTQVTYSTCCFDSSLFFYVVPTLFPTGEVLRLGRISGHTVNGGWSSWSSWSQCSRDCSRGIRSRKRTCSNPEPKYGGQTCLGPAQEYQECNITPCPGEKCTHIHMLQASCSQIVYQKSIT